MSNDKAAREEAERCTAHLTNVGGDYQCDLTADHYHLGHQSFAAQAIWSPIPQAAQPVTHPTEAETTISRLMAERDEARAAAVTLLDRGDMWRSEADAAVRDLAALRAGVALAVDEPIHLDDTNDGCVPVKHLRALLADPRPEVPDGAA